MPLNIRSCHFLELDQIDSPQGNMSFVQNDARISFSFKRMYFLYDVAGGAARPGHAHKGLHQLFFALHGSYRLRIDDGFEERVVTIKQPNRPFYVCPQIWRTVDDFTSGAVCSVLVSDLFNEEDYIRDYNEFLEFVKAQGKPIRCE